MMNSGTPMNDSMFDFDQESRDPSWFDLEANPFPYSPVPDDTPEVYCGQEHVARAISETVSTVLSTGKSRHLVISGKYGNGKSHTLKYTRSRLRDRNDVVVGYVAQPGEGFQDIYHEFISDIGMSNLQLFSYEFLASVTRKVTNEDPCGATEMSSLIEDGSVLLADIVPTAIEELSTVTRFPDFARAIVHLVYDQTNLYAWQWLSGEGIRYEQRKEMEVHSALNDDSSGVRAFTALKRMLLELGYTAVFVFIDEFEGIARLSPKNKQAALNSLRHLMDQNSHGLSLLFGCAPEVWQSVMQEYHAFAERIGEEVALRPLTEEQIVELASAYLDTARENPSGAEDPFTEDGLSVILQRSQGNARQVLSACSRLLDRAIEEEMIQIDGEFAREHI